MILHLVSVASWGDEATGENRVLTLVIAGDDDVLGIIALPKALSM
jgi:hypothetical protein